MTQELLERQQYETLHGMAEQARKQTPHIRPHEWEAARERVERLREEGRRLDGSPATSNIYGVMSQRMTAKVSMPGKPRTMEELISKFKREAGYGSDAEAKNPGEYAGDAGEIARKARGDGEGQTTAGGDRERWLQNREAGAYDRRTGRPKKISDEQRAAIVQEYIETGKSQEQIASKYGVCAETVRRILCEFEDANETISKRRKREREEAVIAEWRKGTPTKEIVRITGMRNGSVRFVITQHRKRTGESKNRKGRPVESSRKLDDEQRAAIMREYVESGRSCRQIAMDYGVSGQTVLRILGELRSADEETTAKHRLRMRDEAIIAEWRKGTLTSEIVKITGVSDGTVRHVITRHRKATGETKPMPSKKLEAHENAERGETGCHPGESAEDV